MREIRLFVAVLLMSILIVPFIGCSKKKGEEQQTSTSHLQNVMGVVVGNSLIVSEDGDRQLLALDLETYELSVFKRLPNLRPWLGQLAFHKGLYYISTATAIYTFRNSEDEPKKLVELSKRNITGLAVTDTNLFVVINFSAEIPFRGEIIRMDLKGQNRAVVCEGLKRPDGLAIVPIEKK